MGAPALSYVSKGSNKSFSGLSRRVLVAILLVLLVTTITVWDSTGVPSSGATTLFPFILPWNDASQTITDIDFLSHEPADKLTNIQVGADGHFYAGAKRFRFFGVNLGFGACFPEKQDAEKIAQRMAKFGINIVRFHEMDMRPFPEGILIPNTLSTRDLDARALDRLDYFIAQLKNNGIYANLDLLCGRQFNRADGLPVEIEQLKTGERLAVGFFYEPVMSLEREFNRKLLTHRNTYTGMSYSEDPALAFVEVINENGLVYWWMGGLVDRLPAVFLNDLQRQWNDWLRKRYRTTEELKQAWRGDTLGEELLANIDFKNGLEHWILQSLEGAGASAVITNDAPNSESAGQSVRVAVTKLGTGGSNVQFKQMDLKVQADRPYTLTFWAKADAPCICSVSIEQAHPPWEGAGFANWIGLTADWQQFRYLILPDKDDSNVQVNFGYLAQRTGSYWFKDVSVRPGGGVGLVKDEQIESSNVSVFTRSRFAESTEGARRDWLAFLWETEDHYWQTMLLDLKGTLGLKALVIGTDTHLSTPNMMAKFDSVDTHGYWDPPTFPGRPWDPVNWSIRNRTMVNQVGGALSSIAMRRLLGKPNTVCEYNHAAPNTYGSEGYLLLAAYAALQDWDAIYAYSYSQRLNSWNLGCISDFFDIDQHPNKMVTLVPAASMFLRGDVKPARNEIVVSSDKTREIELLRRGPTWGPVWELDNGYEFVDAMHLGIPPEAALLHRVAIATEGRSIPVTALRPDQVRIDDSILISDTGELSWDLSNPERGVVTVNTPKSKAVIGYGANRRFYLNGVVLEPGETMQNGWSATTVTVMQGELSSSAQASNAFPIRLIITATGYCENTNMGWKDAQKTTVGQDWGTAPSLVEGISARVTLPLPSTQVQAWALDECGRRKTQMPIERDSNGNAVIVIGPQWQTLWYEIVGEKPVTTTTTMSTQTYSTTSTISTASLTISQTSFTTSTTVTLSSKATTRSSTSVSLSQTSIKPTSQYTTTTTVTSGCVSTTSRNVTHPRPVILALPLVQFSEFWSHFYFPWRFGFCYGYGELGEWSGSDGCLVLY